MLGFRFTALSWPVSWSLLCCAVWAVGCGSNHAPVLEPLSDQVAEVGVELTVEIRASDMDHDTLKFDFAAPDLANLKSRSAPAVIVAFSDGVAVFRWTPSAADRRTDAYAFDFSVSDGKTRATETVQILVSDGGNNNSPVFRKPLGTGTTLDLSNATCIELDIVVEDPDSTDSTIAEEEPLIPGATLTATDAFTAHFSWCPDDGQIAAQDRYLLTLSATDGTSPPVRKTYLIVLRQPQMNNCPGTPPVVNHTPPAAQATVADVAITAMITDDSGLKGTPLLYYSTTDPGANPDLSAMIQGSMALTSGNNKSGTYTGSLPNPVAGSPAGTMTTIYYLMIADDNDDATGTCDHSTYAPVTGTYSVTVTNPGSTQALLICDACTSDAQCGGNNHCIAVGTMGNTYCGQACGGTLPNCPSSYSCSASAITSIDGKSSRQCQPRVGYCGPPPAMSCVDDTYEENDTRTTIANNKSASFTPGTVTNLSLCNRDSGEVDEDWYGISVPSTGSQVINVNTTFLVGADYSDLDLQLVDTNGNVVGRSYGSTTTEQMTVCAPTKRYLRVFTFDSPPVKPNLYDLTVSVTLDDAQEPNDTKTAAKALAATTTGPTVPNLRVCPANEDWFSLTIPSGKKLVVDATFVQTQASENLDVIIYKDGATPTQVAIGNASTDTVSNEHVEYTSLATGTYFVVVKGSSLTASNTYSLTVAIP